MRSVDRHGCDGAMACRGRLEPGSALGCASNPALYVLCAASLSSVNRESPDPQTILEYDDNGTDRKVVFERREVRQQ